MAKYIIADQKRLELKTWNKAYGNNILHLLFVLRVAEEFNIEPVVPCDSVLDDIFDLSLIKNENIDCIDYSYIEKSAYIQFKLLDILSSKLKIDFQYKGQSLKSVVRRSKKQYESEYKFLERKRKLPDVFSVRGHFWHYDLMPAKEVFNHYMPVKSELIELVKKTYPEITASNIVAVHLRESDYRNHLEHIHPNKVIDDHYYFKAIKKIETILGCDIIYHLFSDNISRIKRIFNHKKTVVHQDTAPVDWTSLYLSKNIIQSNSTFCWTASVFKQGINIQPKNGHNYHSDLGSVPYGFHMKNGYSLD